MVWMGWGLGQGERIVAWEDEEKDAPRAVADGVPCAGWGYRVVLLIS